MLTASFRSYSRAIHVRYEEEAFALTDLYAGLAKERDGFDVEKLHTWKLCTCPPPPGAPRAPICSCTLAKDVSVLAQIRWKRLVVDEGHGQGAPDTSFSTVCAKLNVERRWIMSGTPTRTLLGLNFGSGTDEDLQLIYPETEDNTPAPSPCVQTLQLSDEVVSLSRTRFMSFENDHTSTADGQSILRPTSCSLTDVEIA